MISIFLLEKTFIMQKIILKNSFIILKLYKSYVVYNNLYSV